MKVKAFLILGAVTALAGPAANAAPARNMLTASSQQIQGIMVRSDGLNRLYHLGKYARRTIVLPNQTGPYIGTLPQVAAEKPSGTGVGGRFVGSVPQ